MFALLVAALCLFLADRSHLLKVGAILQIASGISFVVAMIRLVPGTTALSLRYVAPIIASLLLLVNIVTALALWQQLQLQERKK